MSALPVLAQTSTEVERERDFYDKQYVGWGGVVLRCLYYPNPDAFLKHICERVTQDVRFLAATAKIPFRVPRDANFSYDVAISRSEIDGLVIEVELTGTDLWEANRAIFTTITVGNTYNDVPEW